jgi:hypothetical protein
MVHVWDALTFEHLRMFALLIYRKHGGCPGPENKPVSQILLRPERELLLVSVGKAGPVPKNGKGAAYEVVKWIDVLDSVGEWYMHAAPCMY